MNKMLIFEWFFEWNNPGTTGTVETYHHKLYWLRIRIIISGTAAFDRITVFYLLSQIMIIWAFLALLITPLNIRMMLTVLCYFFRQYHFLVTSFPYQL